MITILFSNLVSRTVRFVAARTTLIYGVFFAVIAVPVSMEADDALTAGLQFDSVGANVRLDDDFSLAGRSFTVEAWIWLDTTAGDQPVLAQLGGADLLHLLVRNGRLLLGFWNDDLTGTTLLPAEEWVHVAYSFDSGTSTQRVFVNGVLDGSRSEGNAFGENNLPLYLGVFGNSADHEPFRGRMLEVRIWDHARAEADILAGRFATPAANSPGLEALFTFESIVENDVPDATGNLTGNLLSGPSPVAPVLPPSLLDDDTLIVPLPAGSLAATVAGYAVSPAPTAPFTDVGGTQLTDGVGPFRVWGVPWFDFSGPLAEPVVAWETASKPPPPNAAARSRWRPAATRSACAPSTPPSLRY